MLNGLKQIFKSVVSTSLVPVCLVATLTIGAQADAKGIVETNFSAAPTDDNTSAVKAFASEDVDKEIFEVIESLLNSYKKIVK